MGILQLDLQPLKSWFLEVQRPFPWRVSRTPYAVLVSEVMLQQTQAVRVVEYFQRWMERFPTLQDLALASEEEVIKLWEGLGYYSRARSLHKAAQILTSHFPEDAESLLLVPGIGPYTAGAIRAFAFRQKATAVDANVLRVLTRLFEFDGEVDKEQHRQQLSQRLFSLLPDHEPYVVMEGLIELGALVCKKKPECSLCPLQAQCGAFQNETQEDFPKKKVPPKTIQLYRNVFVIQGPLGFLVRKTPDGEVMAGLYQFPFIEVLENGDKSTVVLSLPLAIKPICDLTVVKHGFTRYQATLYPTYYITHDFCCPAGYEWRALQELQQLAFSSGHKRIMAEVLTRYIGQF